MDFFTQQLRARLKGDEFLLKLNDLIDWGPVDRLLKSAGMRSDKGREGYGALTLFKCYLLGQFHDLSDPELEQSLRVRLDFALFAGLEVLGSVPDETTLCRFRNRLVEKDLLTPLMAEFNRQLEARGLKVREAEAAIVDATLIASAARPRKSVEAKEEGGEVTAEAEPRLSADAEARWVKRGKKSTFGYVGFARCDEEGFIDATHSEPANAFEGKFCRQMARGARAKRFLADKAYASRENSAHVREQGLRDGIMKKAARGRPLTSWERKFNKALSRRRFRIEQCFGTIKRLFGLARARYFGRAKVHAQFTAAAISLNLLKACNKVIKVLPTAL